MFGAGRNQRGGIHLWEQCGDVVLVPPAAGHEDQRWDVLGDAVGWVPGCPHGRRGVTHPCAMVLVSLIRLTAKLGWILAHVFKSCVFLRLRHGFELFFFSVFDF